MKVIPMYCIGHYTRKGTKFDIQYTKTNKGELINFYREGLLMCSVYTEYLSKVKGAEDSGEFIREVYGDEDLYSGYIDFLIESRSKLPKEATVTKKMEVREHGLTMEMIKQCPEFFHKQCVVDGNIIDEKIQLIDKTNSVLIELDYVAEKIDKGVKLAKIKDVEYKQKHGATKEIRFMSIRSLSEIELEKDLSWLKGKEYRIVNTLEDFYAYLKELDRVRDTKDDYVGFDTETTGLKINRFPVGHPDRDRMAGICLSTRDNEGIYIPLYQKRFDNLPEDVVIEALRPYIDRNSPTKVALTTHFGAFDWKVMFTYDIDLNIVHDTYILQYLIDVRNAKAVKKLKDLAKLKLGMEMIELDDFFKGRGKKKGEITFALLPYESVRCYASPDADATRLLTKDLLPRLPASLNFIYGIEINLLRYIGELEYYGIKVDIPKTLEMKAESERKRDILREEIFRLCGGEFGLNSGVQLAKVLYEKLNYPILGWTKGSEKKPPSPATGSKIMDMLGEVTKSDDLPDNDLSKELLDGAIFTNAKDLQKVKRRKHPVAFMIKRYKEEEKLITAFFNKLLKDNIEGFIFPRYNQAGTESGRVAGYGPNLQQTSRRIRELFIPESDDYYFLIVDYSQIEYRVMAGLGKEEEVCKRFEDPEADYHVMMYSLMRSVPEESVTSDQRREGKTLNFGVSFGMGAEKLALSLFNVADDEHVERASSLKTLYFDSVPNIRDMFTETKDLAQLRGYVETFFGRRRYFTEFETGDYRKIEDARRKAGNTRVQGTAADIMKMAHCKVSRKFAETKLDCRIVATVHDEFVIQVNKKINPWAIISLIRSCMEHDLTKFGFPPLFIGSTIGKSWADGKKDELEIPVKLSDMRVKELKEEGMHKGTVINPYEVIKQDITNYIIRIIKGIMIENNVTALEEAKAIGKITSNVNKYLNNDWSIVETLLSSGVIAEGISVKSSEIAISDKDEDSDMQDELLEMDREDIIDDEHEDYGEESYYIDGKALRVLHAGSDVKVELKDASIAKAKVAYLSDYRILVANGKCTIRVPNSGARTLDLLKELKAYLDLHKTPKGTSIIIKLDDSFIDTGIFISKIDRIAILKLLDKYFPETGYSAAN